MVAGLCNALHADVYSSIRFLWAGPPSTASVSLHYSGNPDSPMTNLSSWRMSGAFPSAAGHRWSVVIGDLPPLELDLEPPADVLVAGREVLALVWLQGKDVKTRVIPLPPGDSSVRVCILNLTGHTLIGRVGDWQGSVPQGSAYFLPPTKGGRGGELALAFAIIDDGQPRPVFSTSFTVSSGDRMLIVAGPDDGGGVLPRRLPVRRICLRASL